MEREVMLEDSRIVELLKNRSEKAIGVIQKKYGLYLTRFVYNILRDQSDSEECVNDVYLQVWESARSEDISNLKAYLSRIARNRAISMLRSSRAKKRGGGESPASYEELDECIPDSSSEVSDNGERLRDKMNCFLTSLSREKRDIFLKRYWFSLSVSEIAGQFGYSERYIYNQLYLLKRKLKKYLEKEEL